MGGFGSGRWTRNERKLLVNECHSIDIRMWKKQGWLEPRTTITYGNGLRVQVDEGVIQLQFVSVDDVNDVDHRQERQGLQNENVKIHRQKCHFGGNRPAFVCPSCTRRSFVLYQRQGYYRCRTCCNLAHASQSECSQYRMINRAYKLLGRLHKDPCLMLPIPQKPKGMHELTYQRIVRDIEHIRGNVGSVLNIREMFENLSLNIPKWNQVEDLKLEVQ